MSNFNQFKTNLLLCCWGVWNWHNTQNLSLCFSPADLAVHQLPVSLLLQGQLLLHVLHPLDMAGHGVLGVELYEADLAVEGLLVAFLLLRSSWVWLPQGEAGGQSKSLHGSQRIVVVFKSINLRWIENLGSKKNHCIGLISLSRWCISQRGVIGVR